MTPIVGIGASAGGLEAVSRFLEATPGDSGCAFVVILHLDPTRESALAQLLGRRTTMPVVEVADGMVAEPNRVHAIIPDRTLTICGGVLRLSEPAEPRGHRHPIDAFFQTLADDCRERAIGIVLSGTGSNGTHGLREIRARGGMVLVQDPESAQFDGMPRSAISAGIVDHVLPPEKMPEALLQYVRHGHFNAPYEMEPGLPDETPFLETILTVVRSQSGHEFRSYKRGMLLRRIHRRMGLNNLKKMADYAELLLANRDETIALAKDLMISVTGFFRDPKAWKELDAKVLAQLMAERKTGAHMRFWVPACASGEEAYSLAMLAIERTEAAGKHFDVTIFATDPQEDNLRIAREGLYPAAAAEVISPDRLSRFFDTLDASYRVKQELRERVLFAQHDLLRDPPFSRLDLIACRNVLIYLDQPAQERVTALFHFALREAGALFLGNAEAVGRNDGLFEHVSKKWRIYRRFGPTRRDLVDFSRLGASAGSKGGEVFAQPRPEPVARVVDVARRALLQRFAPASVLVDQTGRIHYFHGATEDYLQQPTGEPTRNLLGMARDGLRATLRSSLRKAIDTAECVTSLARIHKDDTVCPTSVTVVPLAAPGRPSGFLLVSFEPAPEQHSTACALPEDAEDGAANKRALEEELQSTQNELQITIAQLETANEQMKAADEEFTSINEELQSTNEELETSKEELQSFNEELHTVNSELRNKILELEDLSDKLNNLLNSTDVAIVFLDTDLRIKWFSPASKDLLDLLPSDIDRPIVSFALKFADPDLLRDAATVLDTGSPIEVEVRSGAGRWYLRRVLPYRANDNRIAGVTITFVDVTERKQTTDAINEARIYAEAIVETTRQPLVVLDADLRIQMANRAFHELFDVSATETKGCLLYELQSRKWDVPQLRSLLDEALRTDGHIEDACIEQDFMGLGRGTLLLNARNLPGHTDGESLVLLAIEDITARVHEAQLRHDASHDELTGLPNRRELERRLHRTVVSAQQHHSEHALCYFDLDQFKLLNDTAGHAAGDALLRQVGHRLTGRFRERDTLARLGGDEFALLLNNCDLNEASRIATMIVAALREWRFVWEGRSFQVGASAGIVAITDRSESAAQVLSHADVACYTAKDSGRNRVIEYGDSNGAPVQHHKQILVASTLKQALEQDRFRLFGHPIVSLAANPSVETGHYEILIRLLDDEGHLLLPDQFIPAAERFGLMASIDRWVIENTFRTYVESVWASAGVQIAINLSGGTLNTDDFATYVLDQLQKYCMPPERLCFEITETAAIHNLEHMINFIDVMKARGCRFALDDFGSGVSSFRYLRFLQADYLKIDGSFVQHMGNNPQDEAMVAAINELGHTLDMFTVAEYAHNGAVVDLLRHLGIDYAQGYAFGSPMPLQDLLEEDVHAAQC